jgi:pimeloyl-ACP methyl ester carboxylesterase
MVTKHTLSIFEKSAHYWTCNDTKLPVIIMIHGFRGTHHGMDLIATELTEFQVIVPDLPGFGESEALLSKHTLETYVTWLSEFITALKLSQPPILLGHSFGSIVSSAYAQQFPDTISKLILVNPIGAPALEGPKAVLTQLAVFYYWLGRKLPPKLAQSWLATKSVVMIMSITMAKTKDKTKRNYIHSQHLQHFSTFANPKSLSESFLTSVQHNVRESAPSITTKTLLIAGDRDDITPVEKQKELVKLFSDAELKIINNVGHLTHYETPKEVAELIKNFI